MRTYYIVFHEDTTVTTSIDRDFDPDQYTYIKTQMNDLGTLEYYAHSSRAEFYKSALVDGVFA
jgi:hypothetical protein